MMKLFYLRYIYRRTSFQGRVKQQGVVRGLSSRLCGVETFPPPPNRRGPRRRHDTRAQLGHRYTPQQQHTTIHRFLRGRRRAQLKLCMPLVSSTVSSLSLSRPPMRGRQSSCSRGERSCDCTRCRLAFTIGAGRCRRGHDQVRGVQCERRWRGRRTSEV
ncbi:hypothetical protein C8R46DRAFT_514229 [Mycena filopes]|nr:hypothetical protein C8R46DRAFT_514229 [Mycena filopes]